MVTLELADALRDRPTGGVRAARPTGRSPRGMPLDESNLVARALRLAGRTAARAHRTRRSRTAAGSAADRPTPRRCCGGPATTDLRRARRASAPTSRSASSADGRGSRGIGEIVEPLPFEPLDLTLVVPPFGVSTPAVYRAWDELGAIRHGAHGPERARGGGARSSSRGSRRGATRIAAATAVDADARRQRRDVVPARPPPAPRRRLERRGATVVPDPDGTRRA